MTILVIAEKPSVGRDLARVLGARDKGEGFLEGSGYRVGWCVGHLLELAAPEHYDASWKRWSEATLPMLPAAFEVTPRREAARQLGVLARLLRARDVREVVNACDAGREGELIFRYVWQHVFGDRRGPPVSRLWIASLTDEAIREGFSRLRPAADYAPLGAAARCRSEADWLVGLNATRAMTLLGRRSGGDSALLSVGRVQTPTLAMVTAREAAIESFVPQPFWTVDATFGPARTDSRWTATYAGRWHAGKPGPETDRLTGPDAEARARAIAAEVLAARHGQVVAVTREETREKAPPLFDLTALQKLANQRHGMSADRTLKAAQGLYETHKAITYPRTDARFLTKDVAATLPGLVSAQRQTPWGAAAEAAMALGPRPQRKVVDEAEVSDHHAILPTTKVPAPERLNPDERRVYELVARRLVAVFLPDAVFDVRTVATAVGGHVFHSRGRVRIAEGWHAVEPPAPRKKDDGETEEATLPDVAQGEAVAVRAATPKRHETQPPKRHTEATLLAAMEHAGRDLEDDALRRAMREAGLGTPATRAAIIETLLARDYLRREGRTLVPTPTGRALIAALPVETLKSAALTGAWEARLARMARPDGLSLESPEAFMAEIRAFTAELVAAVGRASAVALAGVEPATSGSPGRARNTSRTIATRSDARGRERGATAKGARPRGTQSAGAERGDGAGLAGGAERSSGGSRTRAPRGATSTRQALVSPAVTPAETSPATAHPQELHPRPRCPSCRAGAIMAGRQAWGCTRWREGCRFVVAFHHGGQALPRDEADRLFRQGATRLMAGLTERGRARLVLDPQAEGGVRVEAAAPRKTRSGVASEGTPASRPSRGRTRPGAPKRLTRG